MRGGKRREATSAQEEREVRRVREGIDDLFMGLPRQGARRWARAKTTFPGAR